MHVELLARFDDEALRTFFDPDDGGVDPSVLGTALCGCDAALQDRARAALPAPVRDAFDAALDHHLDHAVQEARRDVVGRLFWPLLYWNHPDEYADLTDGETIPENLLRRLPLEGALVCDIGAGGGRCTELLAARAARVIAVDAVPAMLLRLDERARSWDCAPIELRRGSFAALPLDDCSVDVAVACSAFTERGPLGGIRALREAERIVRPGGVVAVIWPQRSDWLTSSGYTLVTCDADPVRHFRDVACALRLCQSFYGPDAARWVHQHQSADVPYAVLGVAPPNTMCVLTKP